MGKKGVRPPAAGMGRPKGSKNVIPAIAVRRRDVVDRIMEINNGLDEEGKGLRECASQDPKWFHTIFTRALIPKDVQVNLDGELKISWEK
jgi:hypothetical protein